MQKKALGRGLSALIGNSSVSSAGHISDTLRPAAVVDPMPHAGADSSKTVFYVSPQDLVPNRYQPREDFNDRNLNELIESIREKGVLAPILVRRAGNKYEIIAGERRFRAATALNLSQIPVVVKDVNDQDALVLSIVENIQRQELNPIEEAQAFARLMKEFSLTQEDVARVVSKDRATIANTVRLLNLPEVIQRAIGQGKLSFGHGKVLLGIEDVAKQMHLAQLALSKGFSVRELENHSLSHKDMIGSKKTKGRSEGDPYVADVERRLQRLLGTKVRIFNYKKRGKIQIEYYSSQERERILNMLTHGQSESV